MGALGKRVAALEVSADQWGDIGRVIMVMGPRDMTGAQIMERYGIPTLPNDFYIHVVGLAPEGQPPADNSCAVCIAGKWLVKDGERTEVEL